MVLTWKIDHQEFQHCSSRKRFQLRIESLMNEKLALPYSIKFPLPSAINFPGGCEEVYYCRWWDCIALPDDVDTSDESSFRLLQIHQLAFEVSL
ncbi:hypothetical protein L2E82_15301 [Cichorium intybus]|uniref:Uncharacterized protein n=3 Tax=Cichorium intybus TaxID=13427 RepID=A0ACB9F2V0_CICIN|nr:hypothetical protein L2E82_15284 [Cichorium intybus]KAI3765263.1 hypothetical protein L2E82_15293 [Cichorium intybus]KAI3765271.1 hypothetical protein L2E82_15301 [Cichorium intybus]